MGDTLLAEYGRAKTIHFELFEIDGIDFRVDAADSGANCIVMTDEAAEGTATNDFVDEGTGYSLLLTAVEMAGARITVYVVDAATKVWLDKAIHIETFGHQSSAHPNLSPYWTNGAVAAAAQTSTVFIVDGFTEATDDHLIGGTVVFTSGVNLGQARPISDYDDTTGTQTITVGEAFIAAPADNDEFVILPRGASGSTDWANAGRLDALIDALTAAVITNAAGDDVAADIIAVKAETVAILSDVTGIAGAAMRGTDSASTHDAAAAADAVWDEARADHVTAGSFGQVGELIVANGVVETDGSNSSTQVKTDLAEATNDHYDVMTILFTSGAEAGQSRLITGYVGSTGIVSWNAALTGTPADGVTFVILAAGTTADAVWDEILTGAVHNIPTSAGRRLRELEQSFVQASGTIATVTNGHTITLDTGAVATADYYPHSRLSIVEGTGAGQSRLIINYTVGRVCTLESDFTTNPDTASLYVVEAADANVPRSVENLASGYVATYTNTTTITLDTLAEANADLYVDCMILFPDGTGAGQSRRIAAYTAGRVVTLSPALDTALAAGTSYRITAMVSVNEISDAVWDEVISTSAHNGAQSAGQRLRRSAGLIQTESAVDDPGATATTTQFNTDLTEVDDFWNDALLVFISGDLAGQSKPIQDYANTNGAITLDEALTSAPANNDEFLIFSTHIHPISMIADSVWDEALAGHTAGGSSGKVLADIETAIAALNDISAANVNSEVSDVITVDTIAEVAQGAPETNPTLAAAVMRLYMALTHLIDVDSGFKEFNNNAGTVIWKKALADDGSNYTEAEGETGP